MQIETQSTIDQAPDATKGTADSFTNLQSGLGYGANNQVSQGFYTRTLKSLDRGQIENIYQSNDLAQLAVRIPAEDCWREGVQIESVEDAHESRTMYEMLLSDTPQLLNAQTWGRLFGGGLAIMIFEGHNPEDPLMIDAIARGSYKGLFVSDRWQAIPDYSSIDFTYGPNYAKPLFYNIYGNVIGGSIPPKMTPAEQAEWIKQNPPNFKVHHSRVLRFGGIPLPTYLIPQNQYYDDSVLSSCWDIILYANTGISAAANLVNKARVRTLKVAGLRQILSNDVAAAELYKMVGAMRATEAGEGLSMIDTNDELQYAEYSFAGLDTTNLMFLQRFSGAVQIPLVRLLGQSPAGLNATGASDLENYYTGIKRIQETTLRPIIMKLMEVYSRHCLGRDLDSDFSFTFNPLWSVQPKDRAEIASKTVKALIDVLGTGTITEKRFLEELKGACESTGIFGGLTPDEISSVEQELPDPEEVAEAELANMEATLAMQTKYQQPPKV